MNDLGLVLAWLGVQVALVLMPAAALHVLASRRGPGPGTWVASLSLGLVLALSALAFIPRMGRNDIAPVPDGAAIETATAVGGPSGVGAGRVVLGERLPATGRGRTFAVLFRAWARIEREASAPALWYRAWAGTLAGVALAGTGAGLVQLIFGLWAVGLCRRRGQVIDDAPVTGLLDELRGSMGCRRPVELREVPDLTTPATAGWLRPMLLLPDDWRSWDATERRAVLAHELAHIIRGDYATGLLARFAVALYYYHPMVRWMAARLQVQQELAADALGARFAGGRLTYLVALSRLALKQDGRSPCWPVRAFLPVRGTLIRRIAMLRDETGGGVLDRPWPGAHRLVTGAVLLGLTIGVATLRGPALGAGDSPVTPAQTVAKAPAPLAINERFELRYAPEGMDGVIAIRPAAALGHAGMGRLATVLSAELASGLAELSRQLGVDTSAPGFLTLGLGDIESVVSGFGFRRNGNDERNKMHQLMFGGVVTVRTTAPFDWLAYLRQWGVGFEEVRQKGRVFYKITGSLAPHLGPDPCVYLHDDRTAVFGATSAIQMLAAREDPGTPAYLRGPDWERVSRGLLAVAINNQDGTFPQRFDLGRPDDAAFLALFPGVDRWVVGIDDADAIALRGAATCRNRETSEAIARAIEALRQLGRKVAEHLDPETLGLAPPDRIVLIAQAFFANLRVEAMDNSVELQAEGIGTLADVASIIYAEMQGEKPEDRHGGEASKSAKP